MTLHPILALDQVIEEYRDYLRTEFRATDLARKDALKRELDQPLFLTQEPFSSAPALPAWQMAGDATVNSNCSRSARLGG